MIVLQLGSEPFNHVSPQSTEEKNKSFLKLI